MKSMTGYGKGVVEADGRTLTIELKSVNNRYLEINSRLPKAMSGCDDALRREIQSVIKRGSVDVYFNYENVSESSKTVAVDMVLAKEYVAAAKKLRTEFCLDDDFGTTALLRSPEVLKIEYGKDDPDMLVKMVSECAAIAVKELDKMRETEGATIRDDLNTLVKNIVNSLEKVVYRAPKVVEDYRRKLETRIKEALGAVEIDENKLLSEVAFFADKADINEEISRLSSHITQFIDCLKSNEPQGRKLDFISQEMNREINTMGSKSNDTELTNEVLYMKNELEKIKEQIRNVE